MSQDLSKKNFKPGSLRRPRTARTVLLRMAADDSRAERIALLKEERPDLTWRRIADEVGVSERAAFEWKKSGGIDYENAKKLAAVFGVDVAYIWSGAETGRTPDLMAANHNNDSQLARIEERLDAILSYLEALATRFEAGGPPAPGGELRRRLEAVEPTGEDQAPPESPGAQDAS